MKMKEALEWIKSRRSCRNYQSKQIEEQDLKEIVTCGMLAPSGMNEQGIQFTVIQDPSVLKALKELVGRDFIYGAPTLIVVHAPKDYRYVMSDGSAAIENMYLASHVLGLGSCWINQLKDYPESELLKTLGFQDHIITGALAVGYAAEAAKPRVLKEDRVHYIR